MTYLASEIAKMAGVSTQAVNKFIRNAKDSKLVELLEKYPPEPRKNKQKGYSEEIKNFVLAYYRPENNNELARLSVENKNLKAQISDLKEKIKNLDLEKKELNDKYGAALLELADARKQESEAMKKLLLLPSGSLEKRWSIMDALRVRKDHNSKID